MTVGEAVKNYFHNQKTHREQIKEMEREDRARRLIEERKLSPDERLLLRHIKRKREELIKERVRHEDKIKEYEDHQRSLHKTPKAFSNNTIGVQSPFARNTNLFARK